MNARSIVLLARESTIRDQIKIVSWNQEKDKLLIEEQGRHLPIRGLAGRHYKVKPKRKTGLSV